MAKTTHKHKEEEDLHAIFHVDVHPEQPEEGALYSVVYADEPRAWGVRCMELPQLQWICHW